MTVRQVYFHTKTEREADKCDTSVPIIFNSGGLEYYHAPFISGDTRNDYGLVYVINGDMDFYIKDKFISLSKGQFSIGPPHKHKTQFGTKSNFLNYYWLNFTGSRAQSLIEEIGLEWSKPYDIGVREEISNCFKGIFNEFLINDRFFPLRCEARLITLLSEVMRNINNFSVPYLKTVEYIHKHYNENISAKSLANMENFSYSHYYTVFKEVTGMSPQEYINLQRINSACFYLMGSTYSIAEISGLVGYDDQCYFSRIFKKKTGLSPQQYRKSKTR